MKPLTKYALGAGFAAALAVGTIGAVEARPSFSLSLPGVGVYIDNGYGYYPGYGYRSYGYGYGAPGPYYGHDPYYEDDWRARRRYWRHWRRNNDPCPDYFNGCGR